MRLSHVYLIGPASGEALKIGVARNVASRLSALQTGVWQKLVVHDAIAVPVSAAKYAESLAHERLAKHRVRGEWFAADLEHAAYVALGAARDACQRIGTRNRLDLCNHVCLAGDVEDVLRALSDYVALSRAGESAAIDKQLLDRIGLTAYGTFIELVGGAKDLRSWLIDNPKHFDEVEKGIVAAPKALVDLKWSMRADDMAELLQAVSA